MISDGQPITNPRVKNHLIIMVEMRQAAIQKKSGAYMQQLLEMYPRDNSPLFPNARIYTKNVAGSDLYWNLSDLCLQVWANTLEIGSDPGVTLTQPPNSVFFAADKCIKPRKQTSLTTPGSAAATPTALTPAETQVQLPPSLPPPTMPMLPPSQMYSYPLPWQYHSGPMPPVPPMPLMPPFYPPFNPYGYQPELHSSFPPNVLAPIPMKQHRSMDSSPGKKALGLKISLDDFCARYDIPDTQKHALASLGYVPGLRHIEQLSPTEWQSTGLGILQQHLILDHHTQFLEDAMNGKWAK
ncbi:hypothetical protein PC9H_004420 [Pleurotus ostreatus]|uniref:Uncharacterized protein n=1 Tax=Pleurotus ostreatus TaxID=5322 RepID=A0A8H7A088_PLEOS|nr:uncharacterized protein PC9H_004420 [Pleurotus ostreatus]KAF7437578.1 hypothetical protein PC9H_004420 [Pleurotus ostreatus]